MADKIVIKVIDDVEKTSGGIFIPDSAKEKPQKGEVIAVGPGKYTDNGTREEMDVKVADKVYLTPIKCDRENPNDYPEIKSEDIIELIPGSEIVDDDSVVNILKDKDGVVAFMGCATMSHLIENFIKELESIE